MDNKKTVLIILLVVFLVLTVFFGAKYFSSQKQVSQLNKLLAEKQVSLKTVNFLRLFVDKVINAEEAIDFDTRLELENAVRDLGNDEVLAQWKRYTEAKADFDAQDATKKLLKLLVEGIR